MLLAAVACAHGYPNLLFTTSKDIRVANVSTGKTSAKVTTIVKELEEGAAVDYHFAKGLVCWTDHGLETIACTNYNGTSIAGSNKVGVVTTGLLSPDGLAIDWLTHKIYWTDGETNRIEVASLNGEHRKVLFWEDLDQPRAIALAPQDSLMFWTDWGEVPKIERAGMNGDHTTRTVIVKEDIFWPNGLTVDFSTRTLYWLDGRLKFIESMDFSGLKRKRILNKNILYPFALSLFQNKLYWTDWKTWSIHSFSYDKTGQTGAGLGPREMIHCENVPMDIKVWDPTRQPTTSTPCDNNNAGCSHLCLLSPSAPGYSCECPTGIRLINNHTCADGVQEFLLLVQRVDIARISLDTPDYTSFTLPLKGLKHAIAIDFDPVDKFLYWTDDEARGIRRARLDGSGQEDVVVAEIEHPDGVAVDVVARNLYWTDTGTDRIEVARLDGSFRRVLINKDLVEPRAIVVAPERGLMFWSDWNEKSPKIERAALDGTQRKVIVTERLGWPNGLALDLEKSLLYWCDAKTDKIEVVNFDGGNRTEVVSDKLPHAFGFSLLGPHLYWTDWQRRSIDRVNRFSRQGGGGRQTIADQMPNVMGLKAVRMGDPIPVNNCSRNNGGCSQLCLNRPNNDFICTCQVGHELASDGRTCVVPEAFILFARKENIGQISIQNANSSSLIPISGIKDVSALDYNFKDSLMYWTDVKLKSISRAYLNGSVLEHIIEFGLDSPEGMVVDWVADNLYWADIGSKRIEVARLNGRSRKVLIWQGIEEPRSLAVDPKEGYIYWTEWGGEGSLERAALDGSLRTTLISSLGRASGLTIDLTGHRIYWTELHGAQAAIESSDMDGKNRMLVVRDTGRPYAITQYQDYIYWTDWSSGVIERADKATGLNRTTIYQHLDHVTDMVVYHRSHQPGWNACAINNGNCTHLCLALPASDSAQDADTVPPESVTGHYTLTHRCGCPTHYTLAFDGTTCLAPESFLLVSQTSALTRLMPFGEDCPDVILPIQGLKVVKAVEFDPLTQLVYWIDSLKNVIRRARDNGSSASNVVGGRGGGPAHHPIDLALDPISHLLFWTCAGTNAINVTRLDNTSTQPLGAVVRGEELKPRLLAIHPIRGLLFWSDVDSSNVDGSSARIMTARFNGQNQAVVAGNLKGLTTIAVDQGEKGDRIYWSQSRKIETSALDGSDRKTLIDGLTEVSHLTVHGEYLYFADAELETLTRVNKHTGQNASPLPVPKFEELTDLLSVSMPSPELISVHPCGSAKGFGGCSHLCMPSESGHVCGCPIGMVLDEDGRTCVACGPNHFACASGQKDCLRASWRCDGQRDCPDGSDEINCPECGPEFETCRSGSPRCIEKESACNGIKDCMDGSDELSCSETNNILDVNGLDTQTSEIASVAADNNNYLTLVYCFVALLIFFVTAFGLIGARKCRKSVSLGEDALDRADPAHDPLSPINTALSAAAGRGVASGRAANGARSLTLSGHGHGGHGLRADAVRMSAMNSGSTSGSPSYHRSHITGASSSSASGGANQAALLSSSSLLCYPRETLNPPPSPATTSDSTRRAESRLYRPYRHYRAMNQPPPPTPCSTDVCDESDYRYDSDPFPPPPTPAPSCPPSPSSRSSTYFNPLPPPPSPSGRGRDRDRDRDRDCCDC